MQNPASGFHSEEHFRSVSAGQVHLQLEVKAAEVPEVGVQDDSVHHVVPLHHRDVLHGVTHGQCPRRRTYVIS